MLKKALIALALLLPVMGASSALAQTQSQSVIGYWTTSGCPGSTIPCFIQYGPTIPTSGGAGTSDVNIVEVGGNAVTTAVPISGTLTAVTSITDPVTVTNPIGITGTDRTITSATGASEQIMAANASRRAVTIQNTGNANCGVNPTGGTAVIGGAGTFTLAALGSWTPKIPPVSAITVICTAAQPIFANEQ